MLKYMVLEPNDEMKNFILGRMIKEARNEEAGSEPRDRERFIMLTSISSCRKYEEHTDMVEVYCK